MSTASPSVDAVPHRWRIVVTLMFYAALGHFNRTGIRRAGNDVWQTEAWNDTAHLLGRMRLHEGEAEGAPLAL